MDVGVWLRSLGLAQYEAAFRENEIDGVVLPKLTSEELRELGVAAIGHRRKIISAIEDCRRSRLGTLQTIGDGHAGRTMTMLDRRSQRQPLGDLLQSISLNITTLWDKTGAQNAR